MKKALMAIAILVVGCGSEDPCLCDSSYTGSPGAPWIGAPEMHDGRPPAALVPAHNPTNETRAMSVDCLFFAPDGYYAGEGRTVVDLCGESSASVLVTAYSPDMRASRAVCSLAVY